MLHVKNSTNIEVLRFTCSDSCDSVSQQRVAGVLSCQLLARIEPPIEVKPDTLGIAIVACDAKRVKFIPVGYSLAVDGRFRLRRKPAQRAARVLIRVARNLALTRPDYARDLLQFAATLLDSKGGLLRRVKFGYGRTPTSFRWFYPCDRPSQESV